jgi:multiple sugar transport system permease protein
MPGLAAVSDRVYPGPASAPALRHRRSTATTARRVAGAAWRHALLLLCALAFVLPFAWMIVTSLKTNQQIVRYPPEWIPVPIRWANYADALAEAPLLRYAANTTLICVLTVIGALLSNTVVAYGFSRLEWRGREALFVVVLASLMLPFQVTMVPLFLLFSRIGWVNTYLPLIVPAFFGNAFYIFLLRQFFLGIPRDFTDAAKLEGASEIQTLWHIILPLSRPALISVALFQFLFSWNDYLGPLIFLNEQAKFTLALGLANMQSAMGLSQFGLIMAAAAMIVLPVLVVFVAAQRFFVEGIAASGLKG